MTRLLPFLSKIQSDTRAWLGTAYEHMGIHLIRKNGTVLPAMTGEIGLSVANNIELAYHSPSINWSFPD
jgi:hypothetical protein